MAQTHFAALAILLGSVALLAADQSSQNNAGAFGPTVHCAWDAACPEITIQGDPLATVGGGPAPFRGYGDPSLELDPATGDVWMAYSWLDVLVNDPGPPPSINFGVRTHLARSTDGGATFTFVRAINTTEPISHPDTAQDGWSIHEVSTIVNRGGDWEALWFEYFDPLGTGPERSDFLFRRSLSVTPGGLGDSSVAWATGSGTSPSFGATHNLSLIPELSDCSAFTEPALITEGGITYLATNCVIFAAGVRQVQDERLVLLREEANGYSYVGELLDYADAQDFGAERIEQADLAIAPNGAVLLIATPIQSVAPEHFGCVVFEMADLATAQVRRETNGDAATLLTITGEDAVIGPGLCTYDAASATGVIMVLHDFVAGGTEVEFSRRSTGQHPNGLDTDTDGVADSADNCPSWPNPGQALPAWPVPANDADCDGFPEAIESFAGTLPADGCAATTAANDEPPPDTWPVDANDDRAANIVDVLQYVGKLNYIAPDPLYVQRLDLNADDGVTLVDVLKFIPFLNRVCT